MKVRKIGRIGIMLLLGTTSILFGESDTDKNIPVENRVTVEKSIRSIPSKSLTEDEIMKAMGGITTTQVMKSSAPTIVSESEPMVLSEERPKVTKKRIINKTKRKARRVKRVQRATAIDDLPMAKSYPMNYDVNLIKE